MDGRFGAAVTKVASEISGEGIERGVGGEHARGPGPRASDGVGVTSDD
jgi:hypothetical protein